MNFSLNISGRLLSLETPKVMGIINLTDDSFYTDSRTDLSTLISVARKHLDDGADVLDLGAFSSRPGAGEVSESDELNKLLPAIQALKSEFPDVILSVDTYRSRVAKESVANGANVINDISGGDMDRQMFETIAELNVPYILMHMQGTPQTMQNSPHYTNDNPTIDIIKTLSKKLLALRTMGVADVIIDPGFGFGKTLDDNFQILNHLEQFQLLECPVLVGISRKSMIYKTLDTTPDRALNGTSYCHAIALQKGANILRVHDVREAKELVTLHQKLSQA